MTYYRNTGTKISEYTKLEINETNNKFPHAPSFICYALNMSGTNGINKNYQVPMQSIRTDVRGFVGLRNAKPQWYNMLSVWYGEYQSSNPNNSYVKEWTDEYKYATNEGYVADKFEDTRDGRDIETSRVFLLKNIPFPFEETITDPKPSTHKIVDKKYVDQRLNGIRKVKIEEGQIIYLRPYQCLYCFNNEVEQISIYYDNLKSDNDKGDKTGYTALNDEMFLEFYIEIPKPKTSSSTLSIEVNNNGSFTPVKWSFKDQLKSIIEASTDRVLIKCFANKSKSTNNQLDVRCTNAMNLEPGKGEGGVSIETTETISKENENSKKIPTQGAVVNYVNNTLDTLNDKLGSTISSITGDDFIEVNKVDDEDPTEVNLSLKLSLNTTDVVIDDEDKVPTSKAVYSHSSDENIHISKTGEKTHGGGTMQGGRDKYMDECYGFVFELDENLCIEKIQMVAPIGSSNENKPQFYLCVSDLLTGEILGVSNIGTNTILNTGVEHVFDKTIYCIKDKQYKVTFHSNNIDITTNTLNHSFKLCYHQNLDTGWDDSFVKKVITNTDGTLTDIPSNYTGARVTIKGHFYNNIELSYISDEFSRTYKSLKKWDEIFKKSVCVCDIQSLEEDGKEYIIYDDSCSPKYISFAEKIRNGESMFMNQLLKYFRINLHNMTNGKNMFMNCTLLQHFDSDLSSLTEAKNMFGYCCLSLKSVKNIADKINTVTSGELGDFGINSKYQNNEELNEALAILTSKGWSYNAQYRNL